MSTTESTNNGIQNQDAKVETANGIDSNNNGIEKKAFAHHHYNLNALTNTYVLKFLNNLKCYKLILDLFL
jgi:hypothetical protein